MQRMERRKQNRIKTDKFDIEYRFVADDFMTPVSVLNVSETGICFLRQSPINKNDQIELMFPFKDGKIFLRAKVARVDGREVGIMFTDTPEKIEKFCLSFNREYRLVRSEKNPQNNEEGTSQISPDIDDILSDV
ncbi:MAG TPA: PilZ domain-containing protein [Spirochaetota bacterium]|nr:PilZ domain-containing protein [Spirochaetota bacterium]HOH37101.1 PilZ domain-containing protein [Spirochaetota bacterium]HPJ14050.1 PilZ domain-containing protein [Spirochaetota bacterium]HPM33481.1 PilZ domain-containing protein [Spirochaetota bacterium]HPY02773.1 PilZ domain-containing protein [Spirochaetota bacterium]